MSGPRTWIPSGLRTPVASISVRVWIGIHQTLGMPVNCMAASSLVTSASQVSPRGQSLWGRSCTMVSNISSGAGSVGVEKRPALPNTLRDLGEGLQHPVHSLDDVAGAGLAHAGHGGRHVEQRPLVERRHELAAQPPRHRDGRDDQQPGPDQDRPAEPEREAADRPVEIDQGARERVLLLAADAAADEERRDGGHQRDREERREGHGEGLGEGERPEQPPLGPLQREHRQERDGDDQQREEDRPPDLDQRRASPPPGAGPGVRRVSQSSSRLWTFSTTMMAASTMAPMAMAMPPRLMMLAPRCRAAIGTKASSTAIGQHQHRHQRRADVQQKQQDDQRDDHHLLQQRVAEGLDAGPDQGRAIVGRDHLDAGRQRRGRARPAAP